ncbi:PIN domain-containing protein [Thermodesulfobacteriota bacterium]
MRFVDTNIFLRFLINDDSKKTDACEALFKKAIAGDEILFTTDMVIAEIIWVLESYYEVSRKGIRESVEKILNTENLICPGKETIINALAVYHEKNIDFIDAYNAFTIKMNGIDKLYSYDKHYDRINWLNRIEPG